MKFSFLLSSYFLACSCLVAGLAFPQQTTEQARTDELLKHSKVVPGSVVSVKPGEDVSQEQRLLSKIILLRRDINSKNGTTTEPTTSENGTTIVPNVTTIAPTTKNNTSTEPSTTENGTNIASTTESSTTIEPTTEKGTTIEPTTENVTTIALTTENSTTIEPTTENGTTIEPTTENGTTIEPTTENVTTIAPTTENGTTIEPTTENSTTIEPTTENGTTIEPTTENGTTVEATTKNSPTTSSDQVATTAVPNNLSLGLIVGATVAAAAVITFSCLLILMVIWCITKHYKKNGSRILTSGSTESELLEVAADEYEPIVLDFMSKHPEYTNSGHLKRLDLGSRMQKYWYQIKDGQTDELLLTVAPVSQNCPLLFHKHQKGMNELLGAVKVHPYLHPIDMVEYLVDHQLLVSIQPLIPYGSLKDKIYEAAPLSDWSGKYSRRCKGLDTELTAHYGRQILEAVKFLYSKGFPTLGHIQTGNIFVVDDVCRLGGYENTLLGYRTRLFRLCKDNLEHFDIILFGHVVFEMAAGYELTHLQPEEAEYKTVDEKVRPVLEYIFAEGFPHDIDQISLHEFFSDSLDELSDFDPNAVQLNDRMRKVLKKTRKGKARVQKESKPASTTSEESSFRLTIPKLKLPLKLGRGRGEQPKSKLSRKEKKAARSERDSAPLLAEDEDNDT